MTDHWFDGDAPPQLAWLTSILRQHAPGEAQRPAIVNNYASPQTSKGDAASPLDVPLHPDLSILA